VHLECASRMLLDNFSFQVNFGLLQAPGIGGGPEMPLPFLFEDVIKWQYHRLTSKGFQKIVRCASVIGRIFSIEELCAVWSDTFPSHQRNQNLVNLMQWLYGTIVCNDYFEFFEHHLDSDDDVVNPNLFSRVTLTFRCSEVRHVIHDNILSETERIIRHKNLIAFYEQQINIVTEPVFIPLIVHHYSVTYFSDRTSLMKRIRYMMMLGIYLCQTTESYMEARYIFSEIQRILDKYKMNEQLGESLGSRWHHQMALSFSRGPCGFTDLPKSLDHIKIALTLLDQKWPENEREQKLLTWYHSIVIFLSSWKLAFKRNTQAKPALLRSETRSGSRLSLSIFYESKKSSKTLTLFSRENERLFALDSLLVLMSEILFKTSAKINEQIACDVLGLSVALRLNKDIHKSKSRILMGLAIKSWFNGSTRKAISYFKLASQDLYDKLGDVKSDICPVTISWSLLFLSVCGKWKMAEKQANDAIQICLAKGKFLSK
jgi:hypothetical protein